MLVGLDPTTIALAKPVFIWRAVSVGGIATISVRTTDINFNMATFYYIYTKATSSNDAIISITLK